MQAFHAVLLREQQPAEGGAARAGDGARLGQLESALSELRANQSLLQSGEGGSESGSDSDPIGDELDLREKKSFSRQKKKKACANRVSSSPCKQCNCPKHKKQRELVEKEERESLMAARERDYIKSMAQTRQQFLVKKANKGVQTEPCEELAQFYPAEAKTEFRKVTVPCTDWT